MCRGVGVGVREGWDGSRGVTWKPRGSRSASEVREWADLRGECCQGQEGV